uniref:Uncharacterized protein n=1 Tax=Alexandrium catenella TaxID=2925 RepID=A0A7S1RQ43_ALECA|mmetsp:Transcript_68429/g.182069  ORF Transcript_68429/g.182069 Transcript_68429/m.182069 type:complete len:175 (+) Transcript_68429:76-600(+)
MTQRCLSLFILAGAGQAAAAAPTACRAQSEGNWWRALAIDGAGNEGQAPWTALVQAGHKKLPRAPDGPVASLLARTAQLEKSLREAAGSAISPPPLLVIVEVVVVLMPLAILVGCFTFWLSKRPHPGGAAARRLPKASSARDPGNTAPLLTSERSVGGAAPSTRDTLRKEKGCC